MRETSRSNAALASTRATRLGHLCVDEVGEDGAAGQHQPTGRALFTSPKHNIAARRIPAIAYRIKESTISPGIMAPRIVWEDTVDITADEAIAATSTKQVRQNSVVVFLLNILANGPVPKKVIDERAAVQGISEERLRTAKEKMGVVAYHEKTVPGRWFWALPQHALAKGDDLIASPQLGHNSSSS